MTEQGRVTYTCPKLTSILELTDWNEMSPYLSSRTFHQDLCSLECFKSTEIRITNGNQPQGPGLEYTEHRHNPKHMLKEECQIAQFDTQ